MSGTLIFSVIPADVANAQHAAQQTQIDGLAARVAALEQGKPPVVPPTTGTESPDLTTVPPAASIVDAAKAVWTLVNGQAVMNGKPVANTQGVTGLKYVKHPVDGQTPGGVFQHAGATWWGPMTAASGGPKLAGDPSVAAPPVVPPSSGTAPAEAAAVGYTTRTFGPLVVPGSNFFVVQGTATTNPDGSVTIPGSPGYSDNLRTMVLLSAGQFKGAIFGGGLFCRVVMRYTGPAPHGVPVPAFWWNDWENQDTYAYGTGRSQWPGQPAGYVDSIEWDQGEINNGFGSWGFTIHNWYGQQSAIQDVSADRGGSPAMGLNDQDGQFHIYDGLWVPATANSQGYIRHFFDGNPVGNKIVWNKYDPSRPPPPVQGQNAFSRIDVSHIYAMLGTGPNNPMTVKSFEIWQGPGATNIFK